LSGDPDFVVAGSTVAGAFHDTTDANGTILLTGTFTSIPFTATWALGTESPDGIDLQIGADPVPEPTTLTIALPAIAALAAYRRARRR
jgi:hypothetical protein